MNTTNTTIPTNTRNTRNTTNITITKDPPKIPTSNHGRIVYVRRCNSVLTLPNRIIKGNIRPPVLVDDDGDILPTGPIPQLRSAAASIYENDEGRILTMTMTIDDQKNEFNNNSISTNNIISNSISISNSNTYHLTSADDDSFIMAYRNRNRSIESENDAEFEEEEEGGDVKVDCNNFNIIDSSKLSHGKTKTMGDFELSGWSQKNRF